MKGLLLAEAIQRPFRKLAHTPNFTVAQRHVSPGWRSLILSPNRQLFQEVLIRDRPAAHRRDIEVARLRAALQVTRKRS